MKAVKKMLAGAAVAAIAAGGFAAPAAAQYYPGGGYGTGNVLVGAILDSILRGGVRGGYGGYGYNGYGYQNERTAIDQCARTAEQRLNSRGGYGNYGYGQPGYGNYGYGQQGYGYGAGMIRVNQIDRVERTRNGNFRIDGWAGDAGWRGNYGGWGGYNNPYNGYRNNAAAPQYRFTCKVDARTGRITDFGVNRQRYSNYGYRGY